MCGTWPATGSASGHLEFDDVLTDRAGLDGIQDMAQTADGRTIYVVSSRSDSLVEFSRDPSTGNVERTRTLISGENGARTLRNASAIELSKDERNAYVTSQEGLVVFSRSSSGTFRKSQVLVNGIDGDVIRGDDILISPDDRFLYLNGVRQVAGKRVSMPVFSRDPETGALEFIRAYEGFRSAGEEMAMSDDGRFIYQAGDSGHNAFPTIVTLERDSSTGLLRMADAEFFSEDRNEQVKNLSLAPSGNFAIGASNDGVSVFRRDPADGHLHLVQTLDRDDDGVKGVRPVAFTYSPDSRHVYLMGSTISIFDVNQPTGRISFQEEATDARWPGAMFFPVVSFTPDGSQLVTATQRGDALAIFDFDEQSGRLSLSRSFSDAEPVIGPSYTDSLMVSPDGRYLYAGVSEAGEIRTYEIERGERLRQIRAIGGDPDDGGEPVYGAEFATVDGSPYIWALDTVGNGVTTLERGRKGRLRVSSRTDFDFNIAAPAEIATSPDGKSLYVVGADQVALNVLKVNRRSGKTRMAQRAESDLGETTGVAVAPNGKHIYMSSDAGNGFIALFERNQTGSLSATRVYTGGDQGFDGIDSPRDIAISPDGRTLVAGGAGTAVITTLDVGANGELEQDQVLRREGTVFGDFAYPGNLTFLNPTTVVAESADEIATFAVDGAETRVIDIESEANTEYSLDAVELAAGQNNQLFVAGDGIATWRVEKGPSPPLTSITSNEASGNSFTLGLASSERDARFECSLDNAAFEDCSGPEGSYTTGPLEPGGHSVEVRSVNASGLADETPAYAELMVEATDPPSSPPFAGIRVTSESTMDPGSPVTFVANAADDGDVTSIAWDLDDDGLFDDAVGDSATRSFSRSGPYTVAVQVKDDEGLIGGDSSGIAINNPPPRPAITGPSSASTGQVVQFDASGSTDVAGEIVAYEWELDGDGGYDDAVGPTIQHSFQSSGVQSFRMRVTDNLGATDFIEKRMTITGNNVFPRRPDAQFSVSPDEPSSGVEATFDASSSTDAESFAWDMDEDGAFDDATGEVVAYAHPRSNIYRVGVRATGSDGQTDIYRYPVLVREGPEDREPPETSISGPEGSRDPRFAFTSEAGATYECRLDNEWFGPCSANPVFRGLDKGRHLLEVRARDRHGNVNPYPSSVRFQVGR